MNQLDLFSIPRESVSFTKLDKKRIEIELGFIKPKTWPPRHRIHKYWGRKPSNIVQTYVELFSQVGDTVLDLFCGSSVVPIEAALLGRLGIGVDNNPVAIELGKTLSSPIHVSIFDYEAAKIVDETKNLLGYLYNTHCRQCGETAVIRSVGYNELDPREIRYRCHKCGNKEAVAPNKLDLQLAASDPNTPYITPDNEIYFGWEMQKLRRAGAKKWSDLFTKRNLAIATFIIGKINEIKSPNLRRWLRITFTSALAQFTKMIADSSKQGGGPSWKINSYWMPKKWQELNPIHYFQNRVKKTRAALKDLATFTIEKRLNTKIMLGDSRHLQIKDNSVDYIFTDPPYGGEGIQYGELSMLWGLWLGHPARLESEIAFNPYRSFNQKHYAKGLLSAFTEAARVLKPHKWMTVTFANKDPKVWDALMHACRYAGFTLVTAIPMNRSAPALTEITMRRAPKTDLLLTFQLTTQSTANKPSFTTETIKQRYPLKLRVNEIWNRLKKNNPNCTTHELSDRITIDWFSWFYRNGRRPKSMQPTLDMIESLIQ